MAALFVFFLSILPALLLFLVLLALAAPKAPAVRHAPALSAVVRPGRIGVRTIVKSSPELRKSRIPAGLPSVGFSAAFIFRILCRSGFKASGFLKPFRIFRTSGGAFLALAGIHAIGAPLTIDDVLNTQPQNLEAQRRDIVPKASVRAYLLVSFSMPEASLKRAAEDARDAGIALVFRGVPEEKTPSGVSSQNSSEHASSPLTSAFPQHRDRAGALLFAAKGAAAPRAKIPPLLNPKSLAPFQKLIETGVSVELNPELFSEYGITSAPVLLLTREASKRKGALAPEAFSPEPSQENLAVCAEPRALASPSAGSSERILSAQRCERPQSAQNMPLTDTALRNPRPDQIASHEEPSALVIPGDTTLGFALDRISDREDAFGRKARELRSRLGPRA